MPTVLSFSWELPTVLGNEVVGYRVKVKGLRHRSGTREVDQFDVVGFNTDLKAATISQGLCNNQLSIVQMTVTIVDSLQLVRFPTTSQWRLSTWLAVVRNNKSTASLKKEVYTMTWSCSNFQEVISVWSFILWFLEPPPPANVVVVRFDSTSIGVSWTKLTLVELKGLANYIVTYNIIIGSRKRQLGGTLTVPWTQNSVIISNLQPGADYDITVSISTTAGSSGNCGRMRHSKND